MRKGHFSNGQSHFRPEKGAVAQEHSLWLDREGGEGERHVPSVFRDLATVFLQPAGGISTKNGFFFLS